jgi:Winged helix-turn helix/Integrase core domain
VEPTAAFAQLQLGFVDQIQWRYEVIRPLVLFADRTAMQRAQETATHPDTVRTLRRRFQRQGMLGLMPATLEVTPRGRATRVPDAVRQEIDQLKALYAGFHARELARILFFTFGYPIHHNTVKQLWQQSSVPTSPPPTQGAYHSRADRADARLQIVRLYYQGWDKVSLSRFMQISRPTVDRWIARFETEYFAGLVDRKRGPQWPRKVWFPVMVAVYHLQKRHPDAGEFRIWSLLARPDLSGRTVGRIMALNKRVYEDIPHVRRPGPKPPPQPHPYKARHPHEFWFIDGRMMDFALEGVRWWSLIILDGYSRTMLAGMVAPAEASWGALMVLYTACLHYGVPETLVSDSGGAFTSRAFEAVLARLRIHHETIESTKGESYLNWMETHFNVQRRLYDYQFSLTTTPAAFEQAHQTFMATYNTTAHQGLLNDRFDPPIPLQVLGEAKGRIYSAEELHHHFAHDLFPRMTNRYGCVTLHHSHFYVEQGLPTTPVLLWLSGDQLRAVFDTVVVAEYRCHYDWRRRHVTNIRDGVFYHTRYASSQGVLIPITPQDSRVLYRPPSGRRRRPQTFPAQQLFLFEWISSA